MKKTSILIFFITFLSFGLQAIEYNNSVRSKLNKLGAIFGDPSKNVIINSGNLYIIMHNPTEYSYNVMHNAAIEYCKNSFGDLYGSTLIKVLGKYSAYFSCSIQDKLKQYELSIL